MIFQHGRGSDCLPEPEPSSSTVIDIVRAMSQDDCVDGSTFIEEACACFVDEQCTVDCQSTFPSTPIQNPL